MEKSVRLMAVVVLLAMAISTASATVVFDLERPKNDSTIRAFNVTHQYVVNTTEEVTVRLYVDNVLEATHTGVDDISLFQDAVVVDPEPHEWRVEATNTTSHTYVSNTSVYTSKQPFIYDIVGFFGVTLDIPQGASFVILTIVLTILVAGVAKLYYESSRVALYGSVLVLVGAERLGWLPDWFLLLLVLLAVTVSVYFAAHMINNGGS